MRNMRWLVLSALLTSASMVAARSVQAGQSATSAALGALARSADAIALARCEAGESAWTGDPPIIVTRHRCRVERTFKGTPADTVTVQLLGGRIGDVAMQASAGAVLTPGADLLLLLQQSQFGPYYVVAGGAGGALPVVGSGEQRRVQGMSLNDFAQWVAQ